MTDLFPKVAALLCALTLGQPLLAADGTTPKSATGHLSIELSAAEDIGGACRISFLAQNKLQHDIQHAVYEIVLFNTQGSVAQMTLLDFQDLPTDRPRVRQFAFEGQPCGDISRILINGASTCEAADQNACIKTLDLTSRAKTELLG
ncbi:hypothetical protein [Epibacterium ulvae]|uniref:hypothetical protein n=1 Tax=Epibacterium ulvae TaxID=1156985 RepID=UPI00248FA783|nr:hypothetical protein [Epibacterium ulvae]